MSAGKVQGGSRSRKAPTARSRKTRDPTTPVLETQERSSVYRGATHQAAAAAYHADARAMVRMGFAPISEHWTTVLEQVLVVRYVHAPEQGPAVLEALGKAEADPAVITLQLASVERSARERIARLYASLPLEAKLPIGALIGIVAGIALCLFAAAISGASPDTISLVGFGLLGMLLGSIIGLIGVVDPAQ